MQFTTLFVLAASAAAGLAQSCTYETRNVASVCQQGVNRFCTGNKGVCPEGKTDTFDETATLANEEACVGLRRDDNCFQTIACC
ncbi:putative aldehyde dehydrogenase [Diaporthe ampelina]|uniref:Putative aldehyde dehydrogenase n=1 Tax=Diaporthe ampelina TaxID=1214573 RepID=A0A0G2ID73_9PEZI|nr:putative aldehyde dehydrogenase [Diaporthe ampelina]